MTNVKMKDQRLHRGENHRNAKLTEDDVRWIRRQSLYDFTNKELAYAYNVTPSTINRIVRRIAWSWLN